MFPIKDKVANRSCVIHEGQCSFDLKYIGETKGKSKVRWKEHKDPAGNSESTKHAIEMFFSSL